MSTSNLKNKNWGIVGVVLGAIGASICCVGPLVLLALGIGGAWVGSLSAFDVYRPYFMVLTFAFLGYAFYRVYRKPKAEACAPGSACEHPRSNKVNQISLWIVTVLALGLMAFPYIAPGLASTARQQVQAGHAETVALKISNMTCDACALTVQKSLENVDGVLSAKATFYPPRAVVQYDPAKVKPEQLSKATANVGYPAEVEK